MTLRKDAALAAIADRGLNVAQFVSFQPGASGPEQQFCRVLGHEPDTRFPDLGGAVAALFASSGEQSVGVRSFEPFNSQSRPFVYGLKTVDEAVATVNRLTADGLNTIVGETIDIHDGGISGVLMGDLVEFSSDDIPRCVEKPGTASLPRWGLKLLEQVYGIPLHFNVPYQSRLEFTIAVAPRGWLGSNIIAWEYSAEDYQQATPRLAWPNRFSSMIGDKVFGLLVANTIGLPVPKTTVINRRVAPFTFGFPTGGNEYWIRTAPTEQVPGKFTTQRGWTDPFKLLLQEDPDGTAIASVISQEGVKPIYSGACIVDVHGNPIIEGKAGAGDTLMLGTSTAETLPANVRSSVLATLDYAINGLGRAARFEWCWDGKTLWVLQLHTGATESDATHITQLEASSWRDFDVSRGLEELRAEISTLTQGEGLQLIGKVGLTSHIADVIRKAHVPAKMVGAP